MTQARARLDSLTKPRGSLGRLEEIAAWLAGVQATQRSGVDPKQIFVVAADHGVSARGVSAYPREVTAQMVANFLTGGAAISVLARRAGARVTVVDAGVASALPANEDLVSLRIGPGTRDFTVEAAMSEEQAVRCLEAGIELGAAGEDTGIVACGEMGIGNTTAASAVAAALLDVDPDLTTGYGTGIDEAQRRRKVEVVRQALELHAPAAGDALAVLRCLGGFEIGVLAGIMLGAASRRRAVLLDGFICGAAALIAAGLQPQVRPYLLAAHRSQEPGHALVLERLGLNPLLDLDLRLGEGSGAALALPLVEAAARLLDEMATFDEAGVSRSDAPP